MLDYFCSLYVYKIYIYLIPCWWNSETERPWSWRNWFRRQCQHQLLLFLFLQVFLVLLLNCLFGSCSCYHPRCRFRKRKWKGKGDNFINNVRVLHGLRKVNRNLEDRVHLRNFGFWLWNVMNCLFAFWYFIPVIDLEFLGQWTLPDSLISVAESQLLEIFYELCKLRTLIVHFLLFPLMFHHSHFSPTIQSQKSVLSTVWPVTT